MAETVKKLAQQGISANVARRCLGHWFQLDHALQMVLLDECLNDF